MGERLPWMRNQERWEREREGVSMVFVTLNGLGPILQKLGPYKDTTLKIDI
jgi:hypothetical protein